MTPTQEPLLTRNEVAERLRVTRKTLERWEQSGILLPVRMEGLIRYRPQDVEDFIAGQRSA